MRRSTILVALVTIGIGCGLFQLKYEVMNLEGQYKTICHNIRTSEESISVLKAEWAHLTNPQRLERLAQKHLGIQVVSAKQLVSFRGAANRAAQVHNVAHAHPVVPSGDNFKPVVHVVQARESMPQASVASISPSIKNQPKEKKVLDKEDHLDKMFGEILEESAYKPTRRKR